MWTLWPGCVAPCRYPHGNYLPRLGPAACQCHSHATDCYYDPEVERRGMSLNIYGRYEGGGVCIDCQVGARRSGLDGPPPHGRKKHPVPQLARRCPSLRPRQAPTLLREGTPCSTAGPAHGLRRIEALLPSPDGLKMELTPLPAA